MPSSPILSIHHVYDDARIEFTAGSTEMDLLTGDRLGLFALFILPGVISLKVYALLVPSERATTSEHLVDALAYGLLNLGIWAVPIFWVVLPRQSSAPVLFWVAMVAIVVVSPALLGWVAYRVRSSRRLRGRVRHPTPTAWDDYFGRGEPCWMLCRIKTGKSVAGYFGPESFASSFPHRRDVYLQEAWLVDDFGRFKAPVVGSAGVMISMDDCELIEFFKVDGRTNEGTSTNDDQP